MLKVIIIINRLILFFNFVLKAIGEYNSFKVERKYIAFFVNSGFDNFVELDDIDTIKYMSLSINRYENIVEIAKTY